MIMILIFLALGAFVGILSGLFGIGGGVVLVPFLSFFLPKLGVPYTISMQVALGTSIACTFFSMLSSTFGHLKYGKVNLNIFYKLLPGMLIGSSFGPLIAHNLKYENLKSIFAILLFLVSIRMFFDGTYKKTNKESENEKIYYNNIWFLSISSTLISTLSTLIGIGGGVLLLSLFSIMNLKIKEAIGTAVISGMTISLIAIIGYIYTGYNVTNNHLFLGYLYIPGVVAISFTSVILAQISAYNLQNIKGKTIKQILACILIFTAGRMFW